MRGFWFARSRWNHGRLIFSYRIVSAAVTGPASYALFPMRSEVARPTNLPVSASPGLRQWRPHGRSLTNAQLLHNWADPTNLVVKGT